MPSFSSSPIVNITLWVLVAFSVITWSIIILKTFDQWRLQKANRLYTNAFWNAPDLNAAAGLKDLPPGSLARIAQTGFKVLNDYREDGSARLQLSGDRQDILERSFRQRIQQERHQIEQGLTVLASIGSTAPFVGLFGTVWGIMHALEDISHSGSAGLDVVAGPIGEALVATAIGIAAAIPAVLAYNFFLRRVKLAEAELEDFATDFLHLVIKSGTHFRAEE